MANALHLPLRDESVQCCVTSPPYWGLRDYGVGGQLGLEATPDKYIANMVQVFREVRRVLRSDGTCWVNMGDSYATGAGSGRSMGGDCFGKQNEVIDNSSYPVCQPNRMPIPGLKPKDLCGIPWRLAFALQQPYYTGTIKREGDREWLAALFDGEGCFGIRRQKQSGNRDPQWNDTFIPYCAIKMSDRGALDKAAAIIGAGEVREESWRVGIDSRKVNTKRTPLVLRFDGNRAVQLARELHPHLTIKARQAACLWALDRSNKEKQRGKGNTVPSDVIRQREGLWALVKGLNQRSIDRLPEWVGTPETMYEPGWWLRSDIIWAKPNPMPESVTDRPTKSHEYIFLLTKSERYFYDAEAIKEKSTLDPSDWNEDGTPRRDSAVRGDFGGKNAAPGKKESFRAITPTRNKRTVWTIATKPFPEAHFATFPEKLVEPCILAGTSEKGCCPECAAPWERVVEPSERYAKALGTGFHDHSADLGEGMQQMRGENRQNYARDVCGVHNAEYVTVGWQPTCSCGVAVAHPCTVLDPFAGSGTTGVICRRYFRKFIGVELNAEYIAIAKRRLSEESPLFHGVYE